MMEEYASKMFGLSYPECRVIASDILDMYKSSKNIPEFIKKVNEYSAGDMKPEAFKFLWFASGKLVALNDLAMIAHPARDFLNYVNGIFAFLEDL